MIFVAASDISVEIFSNNLKHKTEISLKTNAFRTIAGIDVDSFNRSIFILREYLFENYFICKLVATLISPPDYENFSDKLQILH